MGYVYICIYMIYLEITYMVLKAGRFKIYKVVGWLETQGRADVTVCVQRLVKFPLA